MAIPDYQAIMLPFLQSLADGKEVALKALGRTLAEHFGLSAEEQEKLLPSGTQTVFYNRVGWARTYLRKAGLVDIPQRGFCVITKVGKDVLAKKTTQIDNRFLDQFESFVEFRKLTSSQSTASDAPSATRLTEATPEENIETSHAFLQDKLKEDLLLEIKQRSPEFFERLIISLLITMGYGGSREEAGRAVGKTGDNGIDGIISEDKLGLENIYLQAKRYTTGSVGEGEIRDFKGALDAKGAKKGVFITTSYFTETAKKAAGQSLNYKIVLIDGERLAQLMIEHNLGVSIAATYYLKKVDSDFFDE